jgi:hypothetical protein
MSLTTLALAAALAAQASSAAQWKPLTSPKPAQAQRPHAAIGALAQQPTAIAPAAPIASPVMASATLRVGTEVPLRLSEELTTKGKKLRVGQRFHLETSEPVMVQGVNVVPVGSPAVGEITDVRNKGMWGKSGRIEARLLNVRVGDRLIRLSGTFDDKGVTGTAGVVAAIVFVPVVGFFVTGTSANIPAGSGVKAFLDEDLRIAAQ